MLINGVPEAQFGRDSAVEASENREAVAALRSGGQSQEFDWPDVIEERAVGRGGGVVEFVNDHNVEMISGEVLESGCIEALDRSEDMLELAGSLAANPQLAERSIADPVAKGGETLLQDLFAVRDEEEASAGKFGPKA